jgi:hypothetical protein
MILFISGVLFNPAARGHEVEETIITKLIGEKSRKMGSQ